MAWKEGENFAWGAIVFCNEKSLIMDGHSFIFRTGMTVVGEAYVLREAILLALNIGARKVMFKTDTKGVVNALYKGSGDCK
ncbi:conserved hypothetical protein [Ricinus communis]|uniref:RNase H type-1 domain-containing protein n=1 Tax=Ricinus communis TaxID=3988 RepID=B9SEG7_RICCO|nr:conserved hypothetical protein [Ricinus communis]